jgi:hypothetical protein
VDAARQRSPADKRAQQRGSIRVGQQGGGYKKKVERRQRHRHPLPGGVASRGEGGNGDRDACADGINGWDTEIERPRLDGDKFRDQCKKIAQHEIAHGEIAPERADTLKNELGVAAMGGGSQAGHHFLHHESHHEGEQNKGNEEPDPIGGARGGVGDHARAVIFPQHGEYAWPDQQPEQREGPPGKTGRDHPQAVTRPQGVLTQGGRRPARRGGRRRRTGMIKRGHGIGLPQVWHRHEFVSSATN